MGWQADVLFIYFSPKPFCYQPVLATFPSTRRSSPRGSLGAPRPSGAADISGRGHLLGRGVETCEGANYKLRDGGRWGVLATFSQSLTSSSDSCLLSETRLVPADHSQTLSSLLCGDVIIVSVLGGQSLLTASSPFGE